MVESGVSVLNSGRLRRMKREVFGNTSGMRTRGVPRVLMEHHESDTHGVP